MGRPGDATLRPVQVKTVRSAPWYVRVSDYKEFPDRSTVYVLLGREDGSKPVRFFIARNSDLAARIHCPKGWPVNGFMPLKAVAQHEDQWDALLR
jgi:hypothetical protein